MKRRKSEMDNHADCSKPKKSKSCGYTKDQKSKWDQLPTVVLHQIFNYLSHSDRLKSSGVCRHWRTTLYHPKWWPVMKFKIEQNNMAKAKFFTTNFGRICSEATIQLESLSSMCIYEFVYLLRLLNENNKLNSLMLEPSHCRLEDSSNHFLKEGGHSDLIDILDLILAILPRLSRFSLGGLEALARYNECIIKKLTPSKVKLLGLASIKDNIAAYEESYFKPDLISSFKNLHILSIDYDQLSDKFLYDLKEAKQLQRLIVHLHSIPNDHRGTTNAAWKDFKAAHPSCLLRLTVIHAYKEIQNLEVSVLREAMPLSHFKVFFCEHINLELLESLSTFYSGTLSSVIWIDSVSNMATSYQFVENNDPDPLVLMSWICRSFEELILYGYKYPIENVIAIGRLKGSNMKRLEILSSHLISNGFDMHAEDLKDIMKHLHNAWMPVYCNDVPPVIRDPELGDSDEFILPFVLADLH